MSAIALALGASVLWGVGDFLGGVTSRRLATLTVLAYSQVAGLLGILVAALFFGEEFLSVVGFVAAVLAGVGGLIGLGALYRGMAVGAIGVVAPISASAAVIPVTVGLLRGERPSALQLVGIAVALVGVFFVSREPGQTGRLAAGVPLALVAAVGFGSYFLFIDRASSDDAFWAVVVARSTSSFIGVTAAAWRSALGAPVRLLPTLVLIGLFDVGANVLLALALNEGFVSLVSVLSSLYPVVTIVLAVLVLHERPGRVQIAGGATALAGVALISAAA
jgi:drug/metabolite transporter (DMT)-like permease